MTVFDAVKKLADNQKISIVELEEKLNFGKNSLYAWKKNKPSTDKLEAVADYFKVSTDYLLGRVDSPTEYYYSEKTLDAVDMIIDGDNESFTEIIENLPLLDESEMKVVSDMIKSLVSLKQKKS